MSNKSIISYKINEEGKNYYIKHLQIVNNFFPIELTKKEICVLGAFMSFEEERAKYDRFHSFYRKIVKKDLNMGSSSLSNHIRELLNKKAVVEDKDGIYHINKILFPDSQEQCYQFVLKKHSKDQK